MSRTILILVGLTLVLGGVVSLLYWDDLGTAPREPAQRGSGSKDPKLASLVWDQVAAVVVSEKDQSVRVERKGVGADESWVLPTKSGASVMPQRIVQLKDALVGLDGAKVVGREKASHARFEVGDGTGKRIQLFGADGSSLLDAWVGKQDLSGGRTYRNAGTFVRPASGDLVYAHSGKLAPALHTRTAMWMDTKLSPLEPTAINELVGQAQSVTIQFRDLPFGKPVDASAEPSEGTPPLVRVRLVSKMVEVASTDTPGVGPETPGETPAPVKSERKWSVVEPEDAQATDVFPTYVDTMVRMLMLGRFDDVVGQDATNPVYGFEEPVVDVAVTFSDGSTRTLQVGGEVPTDTADPGRANLKFRYARSSERPWVMTISEYQLAQWAKKPGELEPPKAPEPPPTGEPTSAPTPPIRRPEEGPGVVPDPGR